MRFLLDTNICSAHLRGHRGVFNRFVQHSGGLAISTITLGELYAWTHRAATNPRHRQGVQNLLPEVEVLPVDEVIAKRFGEVRAEMLDRGRVVPAMDLLIASTALVHDLTVVTHNVRDFSAVDDLRLMDWLAPQLAAGCRMTMICHMTPSAAVIPSMACRC